MREIKKVDYAFCKRIFNPIPKTILLSSKYHYYVLVVDNCPVSMIAYDNKRIHSAYTPMRNRHKGYSTELFKFLSDLGICESLCTKDSVNICRNIGFVEKKHYDKTNSKGESYSLWLMRKEVGNGKTEN